MMLKLIYICCHVMLNYGFGLNFAVVAHRCTNRQVEQSNGLVMQGIKPQIFQCLNKLMGMWALELPMVLWSLRTTPVSSWYTGPRPYCQQILTTDTRASVPIMRASQKKRGNMLWISSRRHTRQPYFGRPNISRAYNDITADK